jgi:hypothetical protein
VCHKVGATTVHEQQQATQFCCYVRRAAAEGEKAQQKPGQHGLNMLLKSKGGWTIQDSLAML